MYYNKLEIKEKIKEAKRSLKFAKKMTLHNTEMAKRWDSTVKKIEKELEKLNGTKS